MASWTWTCCSCGTNSCVPLGYVPTCACLTPMFRPFGAEGEAKILQLVKRYGGRIGRLPPSSHARESETLIWISPDVIPLAAPVHLDPRSARVDLTSREIANLLGGVLGGFVQMSTVEDVRTAIKWWAQTDEAWALFTNPELAAHVALGASMRRKSGGGGPPTEET